MTFDGGTIGGIIMLGMGIAQIYKSYSPEYREIESRAKNRNGSPERNPYGKDRIQRIRGMGIIFCLMGIVAILLQFI